MSYCAIPAPPAAFDYGSPYMARAYDSACAAIAAHAEGLITRDELVIARTIYNTKRQHAEGLITSDELVITCGLTSEELVIACASVGCRDILTAFQVLAEALIDAGVWSPEDAEPYYPVCWWPWPGWEDWPRGPECPPIG